ncbi:MAG: SGNH/GDSL hydrolase family protein [Myxococcota bacterium]
MQVAATTAANAQPGAALKIRQQIEPLRGMLGTTIVVPLVVLFAGSDWSCQRRAVEPAEMLLFEDTRTPVGGTQRFRVKLRVLVDGSPIYTGQYLRDRHLDLHLADPVQRFSLTLQSEPQHAFLVSASEDGENFAPLWEAPSREGAGAISRTSPPFSLDAPVRVLRIAPSQGDGKFILTGLEVRVPPYRIPHWILIPILWGAALSLLVAARQGATASRAQWALDGLRRADLWLAATLAYLVCFRLPETLVLGALLLLSCAAAIHAIKRAPRSAALLVTIGAFLLLLGPAALTRLVAAKVAQSHDLSVDHRLRPNPSKLINSDGIRSPDEAGAFLANDFVILFLGDSFTFGALLPLEKSYPYQFEGIVKRFDCLERVRAVNFGWTSSSPLLGLRLLREIGFKYKPDLVLYNLDMTDFQDDLHYEDLLRKGGDLEFDPSRVLDRFVKTQLPWLDVDLRVFHVFRELSRLTPEERQGLPDDRFFATNRPLEESRERIERGVMKNLGEMYGFSREVLDAPLVLAVYPRAYQYAPEESPDNWEADAYEVLGPFALEPFRYFDEVASELPYPVLNLLADFQDAQEFPLHRRDDPHWNATGARFMAHVVARSLAERALIPCQQRREASRAAR